MLLLEALKPGRGYHRIQGVDGQHHETRNFHKEDLLILDVDFPLLEAPGLSEVTWRDTDPTLYMETDTNGMRNGSIRNFDWEEC